MSAQNPNNDGTNRIWLRKHIFFGIIASSLLMLVYFLVVGLVESFDHAVTQFISLSYLMVPLVVGMGVQVSLFSYSRELSKALGQGKVSVTGSGGVSTVSMIACCLHHATDIVPFLGLTAAGIFLTIYQPAFLMIGLFSNLIGILSILIVMQKHGLYHPNGLLAKPMNHNLRKIRNVTLVLSLIAIIASFALIGLSSQQLPGVNDNSGIVPSPTFSPKPVITPTPVPSGNSQVFSLPSKSSEQNGLLVQVMPLQFSYGSEVKFALSFDTHGGDLSFDVTRVASLLDSNGNSYSPMSWSGAPPGGHHREVTLTFPSLSGDPSSIKLVLENVYSASWTFEWTLE